ncbi:hypothetical protein BDR07DRAFT_1421896 [Suillus spraguei]|nr:hypothetical protein BDR07DRAFT_1421896 [Suillus spraguei]
MDASFSGKKDSGRIRDTVVHLQANLLQGAWRLALNTQFCVPRNLCWNEGGLVHYIQGNLLQAQKGGCAHTCWAQMCSFLYSSAAIDRSYWLTYGPTKINSIGNFTAHPKK